MKPSATPVVHIQWKRHTSHEGAKNRRGVVYLFELHGVPLYWGKAAKSFGARYRPGYDQLVEACLRGGTLLYVGNPIRLPRKRIGAVERYLMWKYDSVLNKKKPKRPPKGITVEHSGDVPWSVSFQDRIARLAEPSGTRRTRAKR